MTSKYKKKRNKTRKKMKGGTTLPAELVLPSGFSEEIYQYFKCMSSPFCIFNKIIEVGYTELKKSIEMMDNILRESGLFLRNIYNIGGESTLKAIIGYTCDDIFTEICKTKINHLLYKNKLPEINNKSIQSGGGIKDENSTYMSNEVLLIQSNNISMDTIDYDKDYINKYIHNQFLYIDLQSLYDKLKYIKVLRNIYQHNVGEIKKPEYESHIKELVTNSTDFNNWVECSNFHIGNLSSNEVTEDIKKKCNVGNNPTMYEQSKINPTIKNYNPLFIKWFDDIIKVLEDYYTIEYDKSNIKDDYFKQTTKIKDLDPILSNELKEVYKVIKYFNIEEQLSNLFKDKMKTLSEKDKQIFFSYQ